jgi:tRNA threonylcarbamoyl adenosine modification protein (Sua5/YciO/YrdC/YwlC family)
LPGSAPSTDEIAVLIEIDPWASNGRAVHEAVTVLAGGGLVAMPTDSGYSLACDVASNKAIDRMLELKQSPKSHPLSIVLADVDELGRYGGSVSTFHYRTMKRLLPGPYTFIVPAGPELPKRLQKGRDTVGVRVPEADIPRALVRGLGRPLVASSLRLPPDGDEERFVVEAMDIEEHWGRLLDAVIDGGTGIERPTSVVDLTASPPEVLREGQGDVSAFR